MVGFESELDVCWKASKENNEKLSTATKNLRGKRSTMVVKTIRDKIHMDGLLETTNKRKINDIKNTT